MRVTPLDIIQKEFRLVKKGFDQAEVRGFLEELRESLEEALKENQRLRQVLVARDNEIATLREAEQGIKDTLILARQLADDVRRGAHREADVIVGEARIEAEQVLAAAHDEYRKVLEQVLRLESARSQQVARMRAFLESQVNLISQMEPGEHDGFSAPRERRSANPGDGSGNG